MSEGNEIDVAEMLQLQVSEIEMLASMFPGVDEFVIDDPLANSEIQSFIDGRLEYDLLQSRFGFLLKLTIEEVWLNWFPFK